MLDFGTDKYGLDAYIYDSTKDNRLNYDRVLFAPQQERRRTGRQSGASGELADVKVTISGGALAGLTAGMLVKVEASRPTPPRFGCSTPRLPGERDLAELAGRSGLHRDFAEYVAQKFPSSTTADFAVVEAGVVSEETYTQQALYWEQAHQPLLPYLLNTYQPDLALVGYPATDEIQHQFLGLVAPTVPNGVPTRPTTTSMSTAPPTAGPGARGFIRAGLPRSRHHMGLAQPCSANGHHFRRLRPRVRPAVPGRRREQGTGRPRPAVHSADHQLPSARGETIGKAKARWAGGAVQIYLNKAGRNPRKGGRRQVAAGEVPTTLVQHQGRVPGA